MADLPATVPALIDYLDQKYPDKCIGKTESETAAQRRGGARDVVEHLRALQANEGRALRKALEGGS